MPRFILAVTAGALGLAFVGGALTAAQAEVSAQQPGDGVPCYYNGSTCVYSGSGYWSSCDPDYVEGWILTGTAKVICDVYHSS